MISEPEPNEWRVYVLRDKTDGPCSYVGHTGSGGKLPEGRLGEHNEQYVKGRGAEETIGTQWKCVESLWIQRQAEHEQL